MRLRVFGGLFVAVMTSSLANAQVVINEVQYDDGGTDDREFVELYNGGLGAVDISGWTLVAKDNTAPNNPTHTIPGAPGSGTTMLAAGGYYVIGNTGVPNLNQSVAVNAFENDGETLELNDGTGALVDGIAYEGFQDPTSSQHFGPLNADMQVQVNGGPIWGISNPADAAAGLTRLTLARWADGRDTNNPGLDFGTRPATPGTTNNAASMTQYVAPNVDGLNDGDLLTGYTASFVGPRVMTPGTVVAGLNPNAIAAPIPGGAAKAIVGWDGAGGGNVIVTNAIFAGGAKKFDINAYIDTEDMPQSVNGTGVNFTGSEFTFYGLGTIDASIAGSASNLPNLSGVVTNTAANSAAGLTGLAWYYEKVNVGASEKLYLVDAGDGGDANSAPLNTTPDEWAIIAEIDLSTEPSAWHRLSIEVDAAGNGVGRYDNQTVNFTTTAGQHGNFLIGYRENTQAGAVLVPDYLRPPTFVQTAGATPADADFDDSGTVDGKDFLTWQAAFGGAGTPATGDATGDGQVNQLDFNEWKLKFGGPPAVAASSAVPEPAAALLAAVAVLWAVAAASKPQRGGG
jgi:hypothetical protein